MRKYIILFFLIVLALSGCTIDTDNSYFLENYIDYQNESILPGKMNWFISQEEVIKQLEIEDDFKERDENQLIVDNLIIPGLSQEDVKYVRFHFENGQFVTWEIFALIMSDDKSETLFSEIIGWGKKNLPAPQVDTALWSKDANDIIEKYKEGGNLSFVWNAEDMSYLSFIITKQADYLDDVYNIINLKSGAPRISYNN